MSIEKLERSHMNIFGFKVIGKLTADEFEAFLPQIETVIRESHKKFRLLIQVDEMHGANLKSEWEIFEFLKKHFDYIELIAIVGAYSWTKIMSEVLAESIFVAAETLYFKISEIDHAWSWLQNAIHPRNIPVRKVIDSDKGLFTKYSSPDYI